MSDITWHDDMENCPNNVTILLKLDDGDINFTEARHNTVPWAQYYPLKPDSGEDGVAYPVAWARVA
ncbi:hypothetical protein [Beijerinckia indica]|uniref:Uncharacterized protein n=1 Tax=Beijerinckia indica subsp. indica (strain ATCC 9039 / DSM 1715 / NCIMB 8712) TaxID=395963 RepID=B2IL75_BEII9|nr:hypothetical protein [Beijerinckia indica]ACB97275.1 hypothetical protein Bind_3723 [Beijerinckia indica subsp. indica ATCC 9039]